AILDQAKKQEQKKNDQEALNLYTEAAELYMEARIVNPVPMRSKLTTKEKEILKKNSCINGKKYLPWNEIDLKEIFTYDKPFLYRSKFGAWKRPSLIMNRPRMITMISSTTIRQDIVSDCSFVASLCVSAAYERKHKKQLITRCIFPQNEVGQPKYNPSGKYVIQLICNGIARKDGILMCTFSSNKDELWPSIIEKA
ncbi:7462_t:CDS:2, partial [Diversispora eburnea]